ncbi:hypothetical protein ANN_16913 [Periplaneta americana]|uniref:Uncharacterized protein n=1 Tax=Periplaneta americana TaxID=6978 RepID=A0ABQ8SRG0_PERAM|nr:hypothetical protein ANN_16913 [Periplaneta americana]
MAGLCEGGNEPSGSLKAMKTTFKTAHHVDIKYSRILIEPFDIDTNLKVRYERVEIDLIYVLGSYIYTNNKSVAEIFLARIFTGLANVKLSFEVNERCRSNVGGRQIPSVNKCMVYIQGSVSTERRVTSGNDIRIVSGTTSREQRKQTTVISLSLNNCLREIQKAVLSPPHSRMKLTYEFNE